MEDDRIGKGVNKFFISNWGWGLGIIKNIVEGVRRRVVLVLGLILVLVLILILVTGLVLKKQYLRFKKQEAIKERMSSECDD